MVRTKAGLLLVGTLLSVGLSACFPGKEVENGYDDYGQAVDAGMIERGWIPARLPETAVNIHEKHTLDTNADLLFFTTGDHFTVPECCHADGTAPSATLPAEWWPGARVMEMPVYTCDDGFLAVDEASSTIYFWRPRATIGTVMLQNVMLRGHRPDTLLLAGLILFSVLLYTTRANPQSHMPSAEAVAAELAKAESLDIS